MTISPSMRCAFCHRVTHHPAAYIGPYPVGPQCARRHNMGEAIKHQRGAVRNPSADQSRQSVAKRDSQTLDLFQDTTP